MRTDPETLAALTRDCRRFGTANCWTGTNGTAAAQMLGIINDLKDACSLLEALRQQAYMRQDYRTEAQIAAFLGVRSAMEHELAEDKP